MNHYFLFTIVFFGQIFAYGNFTLKVPKKYFDKNFTYEVPSTGYFNKELIESKNFIRVKNAEWKACHQEKELDGRNFRSVDKIRTFLETDNVTVKLSEMDLGLREGKASSQPWSGDYWAYASGILGSRYLDPGFVALFEWPEKFKYVLANPMATVISNHGQEGIYTLSPGEKYDLIMGDENGTLSMTMWQEGKRYYDEKGEVEGWMGICHGWASAAIEEPRPVKTISVQTADSQYQVRLNPSELKGLVSYSWATNNFPRSSIGSRCNKPQPQVDENDRIIDPECFDIDPRDWHVAIVNRLGIQKKSFVMDATYDYQVWNQPVLSYSYKYFNPQTKEPVESLPEASVRREEFTSDKYKKYRSPNAVSMVGISMKVSYVVENTANSLEVDSEDRDQVWWVEYSYDLELDQSGNIIGGEWYQQSHPDFVWTPRSGAVPMSFMDPSLNVDEWRGNGAVPKKWIAASREASPAGAILNTVTKALLLRAQ